MRLQIESKVRQHRNDAAQLDGSMALHETFEHHKAMNAEATQLHAVLKQVKGWLESDTSAADSFKDKVIEVVRGTEQVAFLLRVNKARRDHLQARSMVRSHPIGENENRRLRNRWTLHVQQ